MSPYGREEHSLFNVNCALTIRNAVASVQRLPKALKRQWGIRYSGKGAALDFWEGLFLPQTTHVISPFGLHPFSSLLSCTNMGAPLQG